MASISVKRMASSSSNFPEEVGPPEAVVTQRIRPENGYVNRKNTDITCKFEDVKSALWDSPQNLKKRLELNNNYSETTGAECTNLTNYTREGSNKYVQLENIARTRRCGESADCNDNTEGDLPNFRFSKNAERTVKIDKNALINRTSTKNHAAPDRSERPQIKNRNSFHQDVNEALNSLLWQPYEYQNNKQMSEDSSSSLSSFSSCCSLTSSFDLERGPNNGSERCGNAADLHLTVEMVNNLAGYGNQLNQSQASRDALTTSAPSRLLTDASKNESVVSYTSCACLANNNNCDEFRPGAGNMRVEITTPATLKTETAPTSSVVVNLTHHGAAPIQQRHSYISPPPTIPPPGGYQRSISSDMIPSNLNSIVSANVVGLPNHPRHASVPCSSSTTRNGFIFPNHPRQASEPCTVMQPVVANHTRNGSTPSNLMAGCNSNPVRNVQAARAAPSNVTITPANISCANIVSILSHHRHSSHVNNADVIVPNFPTRSASVPKAPTGESTTLTIPNRLPPINVSTVDVNFYRAVPVTVVSNVPTIQCLNAEPGNNISNVNIVQAMPTTQINSCSTQTRIQVPPSASAGVTGTTQVTVHHEDSQSATPQTPPIRNQEEARTRTFTSTEAQTDDTALVQSTNADRALNREQRRRERRERRHQRRVINGVHQHHGRSGDRLPDLLSNHMPPPYSPNHGNLNASSALVSSNLVVPGTIVPNNVVPSGVVASHVVPFPPPGIPGQVPLVQGGGPAVAVPVTATTGFRFPFPTAGFRSHHRHSSHVNNADVIVPNFPTRSASVPKAPTGESTTLTIPNRLPPINVSTVDVNFYRAVPVTVVSNVPTIQCLNAEPGNNVSNVNIVQAMPTTQINSCSTQTRIQVPPSATAGVTGTTQVTVHHEDSQPAAPQTPQTRNQEEARTRTFTSTEAQTDDTALVRSTNADRALNREQRRRERRERRHQRRVINGVHQHHGRSGDRLPDLLSNHMPPPYSPNHGNLNASSALVSSNLVVPGTIVPNNVVPSGVVASHVVPFPPPGIPGQVPLVQGGGPAVAVPVTATTGFRFPFPTAGFRRSRYSEEPPKSCCGLLAWKPGSLRWFIALIAVVAVCCVLVGTALGAMRPTGRDHLTVSLLMIGVGIVLVTVSGVAWRLTSHDSSTCRAMLGLGSTESVDVCPRRFVPRLPPSYGRPHHPYAAMIYPEFQYRPPPPSYQASMQEYRLRLLLLDRGNGPQIQAGLQNGPSPPPTYRSYAGSLLRAPLSSRRDASQSEYSFPPSYRSQTGSTRPATIDLQTNVIIHSREHSLSLSESNHGGSIVNGVSILSNTDEDIALDNITIDSLKMAPESEINPVKMLLKGGCSELEGNKDGNLVTILQTSDQSPVIVTVSGCSQTNSGSTVQITEIPNEMEILAHL